ncbi:MAG TPA: cob(I)yrinic acid a,c-diamide adenosyltransferase [Candidatus Dorea intestinavium]|nr:cob(I)yrinic acid a,c-diamide adenosyltransferase [Candidatus Dorea intestinavium]
MQKKLITAYCGDKEVVNEAILGLCILNGSEEKTSIIVELLGEKNQECETIFREFENQIKYLSFGKPDSLTLMNAYNFAKKVLTTAECHILILKDIIDILNQGLIHYEEFIQLLECKKEEVEIVITGSHLDENLLSFIQKNISIRVDKVI